MTTQIQYNITAAVQIITPVDVARAVGLDPNTARRYLKEEGEQVWERTRKKWPVSELPRLMKICESKRQRHCRNQYNSTPHQLFTGGYTDNSCTSVA